MNEALDDGGDTVIGPVTLWIGVPPELTAVTAAHNAAQGILALLKDRHITEVDIDFRESLYMREVGPQLLERVRNSDPLSMSLVRSLLRSAFTPPPSLCLTLGGQWRSTLQKVVAVDRLLGFSCHHVPGEDATDDVGHPGGPPKGVILLGEHIFTSLIDPLNASIGGH